MAIKTDTPAGAPAAERRGAGRPRCDTTRHAILTAAYELLAEKGLAGFTIEGVAERAGSAKTTIYRWWASKAALAAEAFLAAIDPAAPIAETGDTAADLRTSMRALARAFRGPAGHVVADLIAEGQKDPDALAAFVTGYLRPRREIIKRGLRHGVETGQLRLNIDPEIVADALYGPILARVLLRGRTMDDEWVDGLADAVLCGILSPRPGANQAAP